MLYKNFIHFISSNRFSKNNRCLKLHTLVEKGGYELSYCDICSANVYAVSANGQKMVQKRHSDVYRIETTIKSDINVSITPPFLQGWLPIELLPSQWASSALVTQLLSLIHKAPLPIDN
jgi:hypothetical protein